MQHIGGNYASVGRHTCGHTTILSMNLGTLLIVPFALNNYLD